MFLEELKLFTLQVFDGVARNVVLESLEGINGTLFAYGQTGSGKTFTITGGAERYEDRGIIPRAIALIFNTIAKRTNTIFTVSPRPGPGSTRASSPYGDTEMIVPIQFGFHPQEIKRDCSDHFSGTCKVGNMAPFETSTLSPQNVLEFWVIC